MTPAAPAVTDTATRNGGFAALYVRVLLALLPLLLRIGNRCSARMRSETAYQPEGFTFALTVDTLGIACACRKEHGTWKGLGTDSSVARECDYVIGFHDLAYAFDVFSGAMSLKDALAARLFSTRGPNNAGVSLTYMFTVLLQAFFFWRSAYKRP